ncbi:acyl-CoA thioesterase [Luteimicrobium subarcticum]|uniref:Acyl-CoA thioesterase-2 n=1 Tax=Luteimicrobium subarcticum TaxID=620910 RepID=A0A2M8WUC8_9MICO|nr:acyl-CoA thioesterase II [Luteimicrobium subarcticum]PJI94499.1 acyl-CoA thioesterase-2 [Luteimicrobium subarcticum]
MTDPLAHLLRVLDLEALGAVEQASAGALVGDDLFRGESVHQPNGRVYGGQVLAQALVAAQRTLADHASRAPHSLHGYFLRPGDLSVPIDFTVERLRDGGSFSARRTHAVQHGRPILSMITSFQELQGGAELAGEAPAAPAPEDVPSAADVLGGIDHPYARHWSDDSAFELRHVDGSLYLRPPAPSERQLVWLRARGPVPDDPFLHRALLLYACDQVMLEPVLRAEGVAWPTPGLSVASLDHAMWWHRDVRVDEWLLFEQTAVSAQGGRGLGAARVWSPDGRLVASMGQEGMIRVPAADAR